MTISAQDIVNYAKTALGVNYVWGGNSMTSGVDCSGLIQQTFKHFGINLPRVAHDQITVGKKISFNNLQPGDMVFFENNPDRPGADHVGIYIGGGKMIEAPHTGAQVRITDLNSSYYKDHFIGGRRVAGVDTNGLKEWDGSTSAPQLSEEELAAQYGWAYSFLKSNKELKGLFEEATKNTWSTDMFQAKVRDSKWYKENSSTAREAQVLKATDPATWSATVQATKLQIQNIANEIGATIPSTKALNKIVEQSIYQGLDENGLRQVLGNYITFTKNNTLKGEAGMNAASIKEYAYQQGVSLSDDAIKNYAVQIAKKLATPQDYQQQINQMAISAFPGYQDQINAGQTMQDIAQPYIQQMAQDWEINPLTININDPTIKGALNGVGPNGTPQGMTLSDFQTSLRSDPRYAKTMDAQNKTLQVGLGVLRDFGLAG